MQKNIKGITVALAIGVLVQPILLSTQAHAEAKKQPTASIILDEKENENKRQSGATGEVSDKMKKEKEEIEAQIKKERNEKAKEKVERKKGLYIFKIGEKKYTYKAADKVVEKPMEVEAFLQNDKTYLPLRYIGEALSVKIEYIHEIRTVQIEDYSKNSLIEINMETGKVTKDGKPVKIEKPLVKNDRLVLPLGDIASLLGITRGTVEDNIAQQIEWDDKEKSVYVVNL